MTEARGNAGGAAEVAPDGSGALLLGQENHAGASTRVTASEGDALAGFALSKGAAGVLGTDASGMVGSYGVLGRSAWGTGVTGTSEHKTGVIGIGKNPGEAGVSGLDFAAQKGGNGVYGQSRHGTGVHGVSFNGTGVTGSSSTSGHSGVQGIDGARSGGHGVFGDSHRGTGVYASSSEGTGMHASSENGTALKVTGRASFSNSGVAMVPGGEKTMTVPVDGMTPASIVLATIQAPQAGIAIEGAQAGTESFVLTLSGPATGDLPVGWFVIG
jgi:hypothetical protein